MELWCDWLQHYETKPQNCFAIGEKFLFTKTVYYVNISIAKHMKMLYPEGHDVIDGLTQRQTDRPTVNYPKKACVYSVTNRGIVPI